MIAYGLVFFPKFCPELLVVELTCRTLVLSSLCLVSGVPLPPQSTESPASLDRPIGAIFECLIGSKRPVYTLQLQYSVKVATSSYTVQLKYMLVYPGSYM